MHSGSKTISSRITQADSVFLVLEFGDRAHGAEDLFLHNLHVFADIGEDGRLDEVALLAYALTPSLNLSTLFLSGVNVSTSLLVHTRSKMHVVLNSPHDAVILKLGYLGSLERIRAEGVTDNVLFRPLLESLHKLIINVLLNVDSRTCAATLAVVEIDAKITPRDSVVDVGILEDNVGALASKLKGDFLQVRPGGSLHYLSANDGTAREGYLVHVHMGGDRSTGDFAET